MIRYRIGLLAFPAMTQLDLTGPLQVFANLPGAEVHVLWKTRNPIPDPWRPDPWCPTPRWPTVRRWT